jgi:hypothetical protein
MKVEIVIEGDDLTLLRVIGQQCAVIRELCAQSRGQRDGGTDHPSVGGVLGKAG